MSAFMVDDSHIHYLLTAALQWDRVSHGALRWFAPDEPGEADHEPGQPWGPTAIETAKRRSRELTRETADGVGSMLLAENHRSVNHRYDEGTEPDWYTFRRYMGGVTPVQVLKSLDCYTYQACEHPEWSTSEAQAFVRSLRTRAIHRLAGYEAAEWGAPGETPTHTVETIAAPEPPAPARKYRTGAEAAADLRAAYKAKGWNMRKVSVRVDGSSLDITVRSASVPFATACRMASEAESISRCSMSGEILSGGNRFVHTRHTPEVEAELTARHVAAVRVALVTLAESSASSIIPVTKWIGISRAPNGAVQLWPERDNGPRYTYDDSAVEAMAYTIAIEDDDQQ